MSGKSASPGAGDAGTGAASSAMFAALSGPNFRRYVAGQSLSLIGTWVETVAQALLVLHLTHSGTILGLTTAARYGPILVLSPYAGLLVDRYVKRHILLATQTGLGLVSTVLGVTVLAGEIRLWQIFVLALLFGTFSAVDNPARQAFVQEVVGRGLIRNAVTLNSTTVNVARVIGPTIAAVLVSTIGIGWCFIARPLLMMAIVGTFAFEFEVSLPLLARTTFHGGSTTYSWLLAGMGAGAVAGGLYAARYARTGVARLAMASVFYALSVGFVAIPPALPIAIAACALTGAASIAFLTTGNSTIQLASEPDYRGRVTALWSMALVGSTPIGSPIIGVLSDLAGPRYALGLGAAACVAAAVVGYWPARR